MRFPALSEDFSEMSTPRSLAASRCLSGLVVEVNLKTAGALIITDSPCGTKGFPSGYPSSVNSFTFPETAYDIP